MLLLACWLATIVVLGTYAAMARGRSPVPFHIANVVGSLILGYDNASRGLWPQVTLNAAFGLIGAYGLLHRTKEN